MKRLNDVPLGINEITDKAVIWWANLTRKKKREIANQYKIKNSSWYKDLICTFPSNINKYKPWERSSYIPHDALIKIYEREVRLSKVRILTFTANENKVKKIILTGSI